MGTAAVTTATWYQRTFHGRADQIARVRREIAAHLGDCPIAADVVLIASELAANAVSTPRARASSSPYAARPTPITCGSTTAAT